MAFNAGLSRSIADVRPDQRINGVGDGRSPFAIGSGGAGHDGEDRERLRQDPVCFGPFLQSQPRQVGQFVRDRIAATGYISVTHLVCFRKREAEKRQLHCLEERFKAALRAAASHETDPCAREIFESAGGRIFLHDKGVCFVKDRRSRNKLSDEILCNDFGGGEKENRVRTLADRVKNLLRFRAVKFDTASGAEHCNRDRMANLGV
jgi:hypothetical protein